MAKEKLPTPRVKVRCMDCKAERWVGPGEVPEGQMPVCEKCHVGVMIAVEAQADL